MTRKIWGLGFGIILILLFSTCSLINGADGKVFIAFQINYTDSDGFIGSFPQSDYASNTPFYASSSSAVTTTESEIEPGSYSGKYVPFWTSYVSGSSYVTRFRGSNGVFSITDGPNAASNVNFYIDQGYFTSYANSFSYELVSNPGAFLKDGVDTHYVIHIEWTPSSTSITDTSGSMAIARTVEETPTYIVKELSNSKYTLRVTIPKVDLIPSQKK
jgi:hypothetical protein